MSCITDPELLVPWGLVRRNLKALRPCVGVVSIRIRYIWTGRNGRWIGTKYVLDPFHEKVFSPSHLPWWFPMHSESYL